MPVARNLRFANSIGLVGPARLRRRSAQASPEPRPDFIVWKQPFAPEHAVQQAVRLTYAKNQHKLYQRG